jgi:hypothetical protein
MRRIAPALVFASLLVAACGGDNGDDAAGAPAVRTPAATTTARTPAPSATEPGTASTPASGGQVEVQGIVGAVDEDARTIEINRLQGADVGVIEVDASTRITSARGGTLRLGDLRPSDRIVARGTVEDGALVATEIEVGQVVPGSAPGG